MKKLVSVCFVCMMLTFAAGAANVGTIDNGYPGDTEAQAQMLCDLCLFRGTDKGFVLEKPMTRAEAAAMLTRFLGAEETALAGEWEHPFTDVPQWADQYVGWLYQNGLTKGIAETQYGAAKNVTCGQYCTFLARASTDYDYYSWLLRSGENEEERCNAAGFVRGDAVSLSVRLLRENYQKGGNEQEKSVAKVLVDKGVFTVEQLKNAAQNVLPFDYLCSGEDADSEICYVTSGVTVESVKTGAHVSLCTLNDDEPPVYAVVGGYDEGKTLCRIEMEPMRLVPMDTCGSDANYYDLCRVGSTDYFYVSVRPENQPDKMTVLKIKDNAVQLTDITLDGKWQLRSWTDGQLLLGQTQGWLLTEGGARQMDIYGQVFTERSNGVLVTESVTTERTAICTWTADGQPIDSITVPNNNLAYPTPEDDARMAFAPSLKTYNDVYLWGSAGLYEEQDGLLTQITDLPTYDYTHNPADDSYVIVTHDRSRFVAYSESAVMMRTGDTLMRILPDGTTEQLLPVLPEESLLLDQVNLLADGRVQFTTLKPTEPRRMGRFTCILDGGKVTVTDATDDIFYMWGEDAIEVEQARLDALGIGSGAA